MLYGATSYGLMRVDLSNLAVPLPFTWVSGPDADIHSAQIAFNADFTTLWGYDDDEWFPINTQTGAWGTSVWTRSGPNDLGGSAFFAAGAAGPCFTQYATVKTKVAKAVHRGGYLRYTASVRMGTKNNTVTSIDDLRFEVTLPPELSIVSSSSSLKKQGVMAVAGPSSMAWSIFSLRKRGGPKTARFRLKLRVASSVAPRQALDITSVLMHERDGGLLCPQISTRQVESLRGSGSMRAFCLGVHHRIC